MAEQALAGVKVIEWSQVVAGPYCAKLLGDMGAEVIKVEPPSGDAARRHGPFLNDIPHPERSGLFLYLNTNKLGITLEVASPRGQRLLKELVQQADILIEDSPPGALEGLGLGYEDLSQLNPRLIHVSITPFGQTGPYRDYKAYPLNTFHASGEGFMTPTGTAFPNRPPVKSGTFVGEYEVGISSAGAAVTALCWREDSGRGQHIDMSSQEALLLLAAPDMVSYSQWGVVNSRATRTWPFGGIYPCKDGYVCFITLGKDHRVALFTLLDYPDWQKDERLLQQTYLEMHAADVEAVMRQILQEHTRAEIFSKPLAGDLPAGPCLKLNEVMQAPQLQARGFFVELEHPQTGRVSLKYPSAPYQFSHTPWQVVRAAPLLGQHNEEVYCHRLGYTRQDLVKLRGCHVI